MKPPRRLPKRLGSALVMTLVIIVLITVVTVGYLASVMLETKTAGASLDQERAYGIAMIGVHEAMSRVRDALGPWDDPYKNFATNAPPFYWSLSPGRITRWPYSSASPTNFALFSESGGTSLVNLNRALADGSYPIIGQTNVGETNPPDISVKWANVLRDPSHTAGSNNAIIGRYAFWVDDEGAKININTADGTEKYTTNSLGIGSPSEVSLEVLFGGTNEIVSKELVQIARSKAFHSPREILSATNVAANIYADNVFAFTTYSRSPDLNVFGQPKMALLPVLGDAQNGATDMVTNGVTFQPVREIYPTPSQLPGYVLTNPRTANVSTVSWPLAFRQDYAMMTPGLAVDIDQFWLYTLDNYCYINGMMLAKYLSGTNAVGQPISWPVLPGSSAKGFAGKYTSRQIDSIAAQICNLGARAISPDLPYVSDSSGWQLNWYMETKTDRSSAPVLFPGFLSGQWVSGMGRSPKLSRLLLKFSTYASSGVSGGTNIYTPPEASLDIWLEWWLPAAFRGGATLVAGTGKEVKVGHRVNPVLNCADGVPNLEDPDGQLPNLPASLPRANGTLTSYWSDQLLRNNRGIDWRGNPPNQKDPDQASASLFHNPYAFDSTNNYYVGTGINPNKPYTSSPLQVVELGSTNSEWYPGEIRCVRNALADVRLPMQPNATNLQISGGIAVRAQMRSGQFSDPDPVPLEAIRGIYRKPDGTTRSLGMWTWEDYTDSAKTPGNPSETVRDRVVKSVIPVNVSIPVPPHGSFGSDFRFVLAEVDDPLVNKFPKDWKVSEVSGPPATMKTDLATTVKFGSYDEDHAWRASLKDPDSYWMPQIDSLHYHGESPVIPRSARFPSIGYLQYLRTGIIPDDESVDLSAQVGTPFRLLSFAPSTEPRDSSDPLVGQQTTYAGSESYPDWALLDLLYVPSTLSPYGGPYGNGTNLAYYGTYGGATAGRINPNGSVIYTTNVNSPQPGVSRTLPLRAVVNGLKVNQTISGVSTSVTLTGGTNVDAAMAAEIADAIEAYLRTNGPMRLPGEVCNVARVASFRPSFNKTRNDLVRQIVGNLTTQGNVFSVWAAGQTILKNKKNADQGEFEPGDTVLAEVRLHFVIERYLDPGADGIYGNPSNFGPDGSLGTYDDQVDPVNHPFQPRYLYRVIASEEIR